MIGLVIIALSLAIVLTALLLRSWTQFRRRRWIKGSIYFIPFGFLVSVLFVVLLVISNLITYERLTHEREIANLSITEISEQNYQIELRYSAFDKGRDSNVFLIAGDEWQLEARILKWHGWANLIGLDSYYQLERIRGRFQDIKQESSRPPTVYALSNDDRGINLWRLKQLMKSKLPFYDAFYGQAVFLPLRDGAEFIISINQSGLIARPGNDVAAQAVDRW